MNPFLKCQEKDRNNPFLYFIEVLLDIFKTNYLALGSYISRGEQFIVNFISPICSGAFPPPRAEIIWCDGLEVNMTFMKSR